MATREETTATGAGAGGSWREVLGVFFRLGLTSFGGPVAHLGYFREEFVHRRRWLDDKSYAIWSRSASSCPGRPRARWVSPSACCGAVMPEPWRPGSASR